MHSSRECNQQTNERLRLQVYTDEETNKRLAGAGQQVSKLWPVPAKSYLLTPIAGRTPLYWSSRAAHDGVYMCNSVEGWARIELTNGLV
jgi:hypothetical protein